MLASIKNSPRLYALHLDTINGLPEHAQDVYRALRMYRTLGQRLPLSDLAYVTGLGRTDALWAVHVLRSYGAVVEEWVDPEENLPSYRLSWLWHFPKDS